MPRKKGVERRVVGGWGDGSGLIRRQSSLAGECPNFRGNKLETTEPPKKIGRRRG